MGRRLRHGATTVAAIGLTTVLTGCGVVTASPTPNLSATAIPAAGVSGSAPHVFTVATPAPRTSAPTLTTTGTAWPAILASLAGYGQWLLANPDPARVATIALPGCAMYNLIYQQADGLLRDKAYLQPSAPVFSAVTAPSPVTALSGKVMLHVTASRPIEAVMSRSGKRINAFDMLPLTTLQITLMQGPDTHWRFCTVESIADFGAPDDPSVPLL